MRIHVYGPEGEAEASLLAGGFAGRKVALEANPLRGGSAAFLDIHYHGSNAADLVANPALSKGSTAAFLDIHYHGSQMPGELSAARGIGESAAVEGGLMSSSSAVSNALTGRAAMAAKPTLTRPGGSAAFLDIHYHGASAQDLTSGTVLDKGGSTAFLDIHYHGSAANDLASNPILAAPALSNPALSRAGSAAFLDIHYHGSELSGSVQPEAGLALARPGVAPSVALPKGGSAAFIDIHYHGKSISAEEVSGKPGLHIGDAALLDIHYHG
jgi:hypothetical protein